MGARQKALNRCFEGSTASQFLDGKRVLIGIEYSLQIPPAKHRILWLDGWNDQLESWGYGANREDHRRMGIG